MRRAYIYINKVRRAGRALQPCSLLALLALLAACSETDGQEDEYADWKTRNETYFESVYARADAASGSQSQWRRLKKWSLDDATAAQTATNHVVVEVIDEGSGSGCPLYTDSVQVHYQLRLMPTSLHSDGYLVGSSYTGSFNAATAMPKSFPVASGSILDGLSTALQQMHIGDHWRVYVPYQLGFGTTDYSADNSNWVSSNVRAYSTLVCDLRLVAYYRAGESIPGWKAKGAGFWVCE